MKQPLSCILLTGGLSQRMGRDKATLPWGQETLLENMIRCLRPAFHSFIVVKRETQCLPAMPDDVTVCADRIPERGPLMGLSTGLEHLSPGANVFVTGCDYPFVTAAIAHRLSALLEQFEAVVPRTGGHVHPLMAVYRHSLGPAAAAVLAQGKTSLMALLEQLQVRWVDEKEWSAIDPDGRALWNLNTPQEYQSALLAR